MADHSRMKSRIFALVIIPIIGIILGLFLATVISNGWLDSSWHMIEKPPGKVYRFVAVNSFGLWVKNDSGILYYNADTSECKIDCWREVSAVPNLPIVNPNESITNDSCSLVPPLTGVVARIAQCRITELNWGLHQNYVYALRNDGNIYLWHTDFYTGEGGAIFLYLLLGCIGGIVFFIPVLFFVLFFGLLDLLESRAQRAKENISNQTNPSS